MLFISDNMKIGIRGGLHHKNRIGIDLMNGKGIDFSWNIEDPQNDWIMFTDSFNPPVTGKTKIIYGPHISLERLSSFPEGPTYYFNSLSPWLADLTKQLFGNRKFITLPFPVDVDKFCPQEKEGNPVIYFKRRSREILENFKNSFPDIEFDFFDYTQKYEEDNFLNKISRAPYCIWIGTHESQGFALQETLSCNTPVFVIEAKDLRDEQGGPWDSIFPGKDLPCTSASYFDDRCGLISSPEDFKINFPVFLERLNLYSPREFILETLSPESCIDIWCKFLK
jgi:hypothetical protein